MATKKQKREAAEAKRAAFMAQVRAEGLAAQKADHERQKAREEAIAEAVGPINQRHRTTLLNKGINPSTGVVFTNSEMAEMRKKANTPERKALLGRIAAGRAGTLNEQPPVDGTDDYLDPLEGMTVGEFRDQVDRMNANLLTSSEDMRKHLFSDPDMLEGVEETAPIPSTRFF